MRTTKDRIRHALGFEIIGLLIFAPLASLVFGFELHLMGMMALVGSIVATIWNYFYNILFDRGMLKLCGTLQKTVLIRVLHAILFEGGLLLLFLPVIAWYLNITWLAAAALEAGFLVFILIYTYIFNVLYDKHQPYKKWVNKSQCA